MCLQKTWPGSLQCAGSLDVTCTRPWGTPSDWWSPAGEGRLSKPGPPPQLCSSVDWRTARSKRTISCCCLPCTLVHLFCFGFNTKSKNTHSIMGNLDIVTESTNLQNAFNWNVSERQETNQHDKLQSPSINEIKIKLFTWNVSSVLWIYLTCP